MPRLIKFKDQSTITYTYAADGTKLRVEHKIGSSTTRTTYCSNVIYEDGTAKCLLTEEGYVSLDDREYHYYLKDHQGNNRVLVNKKGGVEEINHYYPFGGVFASEENVQPYKYNGKELDTKKGLNWYDYGARQYDAALGIFTTVDPSSEKYYPTSPYVYCGGDPINRIDPTGADWYKDSDGNYHWAERGDDITEGWTWVGSSVSIEISKSKYVNYYENGGIVANKPVNAFDLIASSPKLQNLFLGENSLLSEASKSRLLNGLVSRGTDAIARPIGEFLVWSGAGELGGPLVGKAVGWAFGRFAGLFTCKGFASFSAFKKAYGAAGQGMAWHHIVEQNADNIARFGAEKIHNTKNLIRLPHGKGSIHAKVSGYYSSKSDFTNGLTVRDWLKSQSYAEQYKFGVETLKRFGWKP